MQWVPIFVKQTLLNFKSHIKHYIMIVGDLKHPFPQWPDYQNKLSRKIVKLTDVMKQMDLSDIYRDFHSNTKNIPSLHLMEHSPKLTI